MVGHRAPQKIAIVTVHGTGDTAESPDGGKWFQRGSAFTEGLKGRLVTKGLHAEVLPFLWSGANSASARERGATALAREVRRIASRYSGVHLIGHSHGGNVANEAAILLGWGRGKQHASRNITSLTTIGTPFLIGRTGAMQSLAGLTFLGVTLASVPLYIVSTALLLLWVLGIADPMQISEGLGSLSNNGWLILIACSLAVGIPLWFMLRLGVRGWRQIMRPRSFSDTNAAVFSVWHANDEAISFLQQVEAVPLEPFPLGSMMRGSRWAAVSAGVLVVILASFVPAAVFMASSTGWFEAPWASPYWFWTSTLTLLFASPLVFASTYLVVRGIASSVGEVVARPQLNNWVGGVVRGIAFGKDSDLTIGQVSTRSHSHPTRELKIEGAVAERMQTNAAGAAASLIEKYRWALFTVGADTNGPLSKMANDAMTWSSLIHTTYFDQPEVADFVAQHIADEAMEQQTSVAPAASADSTARPRAQPIAPPKKPHGFGVAGLGIVLLGIGAILGVGSMPSWLPIGGPPGTETPVVTKTPAAREAGTPTYRDCDECPEMSPLPGARYLMGASEDDPGRRPWEQPQHQVRLTAFAIGIREVTFAEWDACVAAGGCERYQPYDRGWGRGERPVMMVSWVDAQSYLRWLTRRTGRTYRLPSEAEWEYAARAGAASPYWWGQRFDPALAPRGSTSVSGALPANAFGLHDVTGNVGEWVQDCYVNTYADAPTDGRPMLQGDCATRVVRGGSWRDDASALRIAARSRVAAVVRDASIGFRVVSEL